MTISLSTTKFLEGKSLVHFITILKNYDQADYLDDERGYKQKAANISTKGVGGRQGPNQTTKKEI